MGIADDGQGQRMYELVRELFPFCRSITGDGVRRTLESVGRHIPLEIKEVASGTPVLDWTVPNEWNIRDAWIKNRAGERVVDFRRSNLHVVSYSIPVHRWVPIDELREHLFSLPDRPELIPYRTSYYKESWGFCIPHSLLESLTDAEYEVCVDSTLETGYLTYGEYVVPGDTELEVLISSHVCHPSLCNDNLSGISAAVFLAQWLQSLPARRYTYRFLFIPVTIGSITWLAMNRDRVGRVRHGLVLTCVGDGAPFTYKKSRRGDVEIDRVVQHVLRHSEAAFRVQDFFPYGYDERQFCSPGFNLAVGCLMRSTHGTFPEYHTSADDLSFVRPEHLFESLARLVDVIEVLEGNRVYVNLKPEGEPQLGRRGLYDAIGGDSHAANRQLAMLWMLNMSDGKHTLLEIAEMAKVPFEEMRAIAELLEQHALIARADSLDEPNARLAMVRS